MSERSPDLLATLDVARDATLNALATLPQAPSALRFRAGAVHIDVAWGATGPRPEEGVRPAAPGLAEEERRHSLRAPTVGIVSVTPEPDGEPFVEVGDRVAVGQQVATVRIMDLELPVRADVAGTIVEILAKDGEAVEHDTHLFVVDGSSDT